MNKVDLLQQLERLRRRLAASENTDTLRHLARHVDELRWVAPDSVLEMIATFSDLVADKVERCTPASTKVAARK